MELPFRKIIIILFAVSFPIGAYSTEPEPNPIVDFFKKLGNSIAHPKSSPPPHKTAKKKSAAVKGSTNQNKTAPQQESNTGPAQPEPPPPTPTPEPTPAPHLTSRPTPPPRHVPMPVPVVVRSAVGVPPPAKKPLPDVPFGIPIPNKSGFVTSPYAPNAGYVDVRGFASGSLVKDPYTGKNFLVP
jgi:hypothetical protein